MPEANEGENQVETWEKVLITSGYTGYAKIHEKLVPNLFKNKLRILCRDQ